MIYLKVKRIFQSRCLESRPVPFLIKNNQQLYLKYLYNNKADLKLHLQLMVKIVL